MISQSVAHPSRITASAFILVLFSAVSPGRACDLCSIYNADTLRGERTSGFLFSISELFVPYRTEQLNSEETSVADSDYLDSSITHLVPTYNFAKNFGVSLNAPIIYRDFKRKSVVVGANRQLRIMTEEEMISVWATLRSSAAGLRSSATKWNGRPASTCWPA